MKHHRLPNTALGAILLALLFAAVLIAVCTVDVQPVENVSGTRVGLFGLNSAFRDRIGESTHETAYKISKYLGYAVILTAAVLSVMTVLGAVTGRMEKRQLSLIAVFVLIAVFYILFEKLAINYRPFGEPDPSFPSTHCLLAVGVMGCAAVWFRRNVRSSLGRLLIVCSIAVMVLTVATRTLANVHWLTDIVAGCLLGGSLCCLYAALFPSRSK